MSSELIKNSKELILSPSLWDGHLPSLWALGYWFWCIQTQVAGGDMRIATDGRVTN